MIGIENNTDIAFRLINFAMVSAFIGYVFINYILPKIKSDFNEQLMHVATLKNTHATLCDKKQILEQSIKDDVLMQQKLKEKHTEWRLQMDKRYKESIAARTARIQALREQMDLYAQHIEKERMLRAMMPVALDQARVLLQQKYAPHAKHETYLDTLCDGLNKGTHAQ
jgi:hypothetical protein